MQKKGIVIFVVLLALAVIAIVVADLVKNQTDKRPDNPYELEYSHMKQVNPELISHKETKNFKLQGDSLGAILLKDSFILVTVDNNLLFLAKDGGLIKRIDIKGFARGLTNLMNDKLAISYYNTLALIDLNGNVLLTKDAINDKSIITNLAAKEKQLMVADAGNRVVYELDENLELKNTIEGKREEGAKHGFILPSANFDLAYSNEGELWVANPGMHALENYDETGKLRSFWEATSFKIDGFSGCCNPGRFTIDGSGRFITSEKGIVRIKIHAPSGEFVSVVAEPQKFMEDGKAPDVAVDADNVVYALDYDKKMIRVFEPITE